MSGSDLTWLRLSIHHPPHTAEALSDFLFGLGAMTLWEDHPDECGRLITRAGFKPEAQNMLESRLPEIISRLAEAFELPPEVFCFFLNIEDDHNWAEKWKEGLEPVNVPGGLTIAPTWWPEDQLPTGGQSVVLRLDPGLAFGSGHHATTFLCLHALTGLAPKARRVLDVGAGSGVLSLAVAALACPEAEIVGVDNDPDTISVAFENAELNRLSKRVDFSARPLVELDPPFDLILANITKNPLLELAPEISRLADGGTALVLSGLLDIQVNEVASAYEGRGWGWHDYYRREEWAALVLIKGAGGKAPVPQTI